METTPFGYGRATEGIACREPDGYGACMRMPRLFLPALLLMLPATRAEEGKRPTVGLVLGGGGALGFAHIGVLQELEALRVPVDYIAGTSMGSIVGGMYASGMSPEEMERAFLGLDWWDVLKDKAPHQYLTYRRKEEDKRFMGAEFGLQDRRLVFSPGMAYGQKLNNVLGTFALNSAGIHDFDKLNIPYRAIATDLRTGTSVVLASGDLATAMRASMAVPGAFTPVRLDDMVLIDGGILNNIPVDVAKAMGADIVIAVDVGASAVAKGLHSDFNALGDVVGRTYTIMQRPDQERQLALADVVVAPNLEEASASQFHKAASIIPRGREAARQMAASLSAYSVDEETYARFLQRQRAKNNPLIDVSGIVISGNEGVPEGAIRSRIRSKNGPLLLEEVYRDLNRIHGTGLFQNASYVLHPQDDGSDILEFRTEEKFWGPTLLHVGTKLETASDAAVLWSILLNYNRLQLNPCGGEIRAEIEAGGYVRKLQAEWYQPIDPAGRLFLAPSAAFSSEDIDFYWGEDVVAEIGQELVFGKLDAGLSGFEYGEFRGGMLVGHAWADGNSGFVSLGKEDDSVVGATTRIRVDQLDDPVFPTKGFRLSLDGLFAREEMGSSKTFDRIEAEGLLPLTLGRHTVTPKLAGGSSMDTELPFYALFDVGGLDGFAGYAPYQLWGYYYGVASLGYRYRLGKLPPAFGNGLFALLRYDTGNAWLAKEDIDMDNLAHGGLVGLAADTIAGKCTIALGKAEGLNIRFYFSIGNTF